MSEGPTYAVSPFNHAQADIILRTSDNIDFRIFRLFLSLASPFFETLFDIPQPAEEDGDQEVRDGLAVIPVTEDSRTLDALLRFCYPCTLAEDPKLDVLKDAMDVLEAARKYSLEVIEKKARQAIADPRFLKMEPMRCFAVAHRGRLREETLLAARYTLTQSLIPSWFEEIELITATDLLALLTYHKKCADAVYVLKSNLSWITSQYGTLRACVWFPTTSSGGGSCGCAGATLRKHTIHGYTFQWWEDFIEDTFVALRDKPCKETVQAFVDTAVQTVRGASGCYNCSSRIAEGMREFSEFFGRKIEETTSQVELELDF